MSGDFQDSGSTDTTPRSPSDQTVDREEPSTTVLIAFLGGCVGILLSFLPFSTVVGGAVAGYLDGGGYIAGAKVGGLAGGVAFVPFAFGLGFVFVWLPAITGLHLGDEPALWVRVLVTVGLAAVYTVGFGSSGGLIGAYVKNAA